jgi:single-strand DNA-binding protein
VASNFTLLEKKGDASDHSNYSSGQSNNRAKQQGFDEFNQSADPFSGAGESIDIGDDDLPF